MRWSFIPLLVGAAAVLCNVAPAVSQSAYNSPVCIEYGDGKSRSCFYSNYGRCRYDALRTFGAVCTRNPFYRGSAGRRPHRDARPRHHRKRS
jgi:hypothetical protein